MRQATDYAQRLQCRMAYASNGHQQPGDNPAEPAYAAVWRQRFAQIPFEATGDWAPRYYQENAINNALDAIARGEQRVLLTLATGTGKTCIAFQTACGSCSRANGACRPGARRASVRASCFWQIATCWPIRPSMILVPLAKMPWCASNRLRSRRRGRCRKTPPCSSPSSRPS